MTTIEVDFDVFRALTIRRTHESISNNDVLRQLLDLPERSREAPAPSTTGSPGGMRAKGAFFPNGSELRATYKYKTYLAKIDGDAIQLNGRSFDSPSAAARSITGAAVNGWEFWDIRLPGQDEWKLISSFRS